MARDPGRLRRPGSGSSPVDQLEVWRNWRHDTVEFPAVPGTVVDDRVRTGRPWRPRSSIGFVIGATLLFGALVLSGLTALGVGPVARLVGSGAHAPSPATRSTPSGTATPSSSAPSSSAPSSSTPSSSTPSSSTSGATTPEPVAPTAAGPGDRRPGPPGPAGTRGSPPQPPVGGPAG